MRSEWGRTSGTQSGPDVRPFDMIRGGARCGLYVVCKYQYTECSIEAAADLKQRGCREGPELVPSGCRSGPLSLRGRALLRPLAMAVFVSPGPSC